MLTMYYKYLLSHYEDICLIYEYMLKHDTYVEEFLCINSKELLLTIFIFDSNFD